MINKAIELFEKEKVRIFTKIHQQLTERKTIGKSLNFKNPWILIATWFGSGVFLPASGTWGTIATIPFVIPLWIFGGKLAVVVFLIVVFFLGLKASAVFEKETNTHDSGLIVVDEVIGFTIAVLALNSHSSMWVFIAFVLFRGFDTMKPWPISWIDSNTQGAWGVIADDLAAGVATALVILGLQYAHIFG